MIRPWRTGYRASIVTSEPDYWYDDGPSYGSEAAAVRAVSKYLAKADGTRSLYHADHAVVSGPGRSPRWFRAQPEPGSPRPHYGPDARPWVVEEWEGPALAREVKPGQTGTG